MDKLYGFLALKIFSSSSSNISLQDNKIGLAVLVCVILHLF
jgi:hypothetical protein